MSKARPTRKDKLTTRLRNRRNYLARKERLKLQPPTVEHPAETYNRKKRQRDRTRKHRENQTEQQKARYRVKESRRKAALPHDHPSRVKGRAQAKRRYARPCPLPAA